MATTWPHGARAVVHVYDILRTFSLLCFADASRGFFKTVAKLAESFVFIYLGFALFSFKQVHVTKLRSWLQKFQKFQKFVRNNNTMYFYLILYNKYIFLFKNNDDESKIGVSSDFFHPYSWEINYWNFVNIFDKETSTRNFTQNSPRILEIRMLAPGRVLCDDRSIFIPRILERTSYSLDLRMIVCGIEVRVRVQPVLEWTEMVVEWPVWMVSNVNVWFFQKSNSSVWPHSLYFFDIFLSKM